ncbi:lymphatic vessel endothelial hyaluronic receptor 1b isoform 2-T2 [Pholidichthys leucotaenia]
MAIFGCFTSLLLLSFAAFWVSSGSSLTKVVPPSYRATGVFMLIEGEKYTLNYSAARDACRSLNVSMATKPQMAQAVRHGLETCKFGWVKEKFAVIPRVISENKCGNGKTGVVTWHAPITKEFGVFCFNASVLEEPTKTPKTSPTHPQSSTSFTTTMTPLTQTQRPPTTRVSATTTFLPSTKKPSTAKPPQMTSSPSAFTVFIKTTQPTRISYTSTPSSKPLSTHVNVNFSHLITSRSTGVSFTIYPSNHGVNGPVPSESAVQKSVRSSLGAVPTAIIIFSIILLLLIVVGAVWYYKLCKTLCSGVPNRIFTLSLWNILAAGLRGSRRMTRRRRCGSRPAVRWTCTARMKQRKRMMKRSLTGSTQARWHCVQTHISMENLQTS